MAYEIQCWFGNINELGQLVIKPLTDMDAIDFFTRRPGR
jgi:hypothetical protein